MPKGIPFKSEQERKEARKKRYEKIKHTEEYKIKQRQRTKRYYDKNKRKQADRVKEYYAKNKEKILKKRTKNEKYKKYQKEYQKEYQKKYQKEKREYQRELYGKSDDYRKYQREKLKKWREKNKEKVRHKASEDYKIKKYGSLENYEIYKKTQKQNQIRKRKPKVQPLINKQCAQCGKNMFVVHPKHKFCSDKCRNKFMNNLKKTDPMMRMKRKKYAIKYKRTEKFKELQKKYREKYDKTHKGKINDLWDTLRKRIKIYMQKKDLHSDRKDMEFLVGCSKIFLMEYLEAQFYDHPINNTKMTWQNKKEWHIDHLTPLAKLDPTNPKHLTASNHFSNLRPMWSDENISKGANVLSGYGVAHLLRKHHKLKKLDLISIKDHNEAKRLAKKILKDLNL